MNFKFLLVPAMLMVVMFSLVACGEDGTTAALGEWTTLSAPSLFEDGLQARAMSDGTVQTAPISSHGKTHELADYFTFHPEKVSTSGTHHTVLKTDAATYFSTDPAVRNHDFVNNEFKVSFSLSADMKDNDYFIFVLAFNKEGAAAGTYTHVTEFRIAVAKIDGQLKACSINGVSNDAANLSYVKANGINITALDTLRFDVIRDAPDTLHITMHAGATELHNATVSTSANVVGARSLWLAAGTVDVTIWHLGR